MKTLSIDIETFSSVTAFIEEHPISAVFVDMGLGKTVTTLTAIYDLCFDSFEIRKVLVIAPLRVARDTWPAEIEKWDHLKGLTYSVAVGTELERKAALMQEANVYIINRENVIHHIIAAKTIDEKIMNALFQKDKTQSALIDAVKATLEVSK